jgi:hypothetical protein
VRFLLESQNSELQSFKINPFIISYRELRRLALQVHLRSSVQFLATETQISTENFSEFSYKNPPKNSMGHPKSITNSIAAMLLATAQVYRTKQEEWIEYSLTTSFSPDISARD